jgi:hypothetical protein
MLCVYNFKQRTVLNYYVRRLKPPRQRYCQRQVYNFLKVNMNVLLYVQVDVLKTKQKSQPTYISIIQLTAPVAPK